MKVKDERKVTAIYAATVALVGEVGLAGLRMSAIAERASLASGTLYIYFESKEVLLNTLYKKIVLEGTIQVFEKIRHLSIKKQFSILWESTVRFRYERNAEIVFVDQFKYSPMMSEESNQITEKFIAHLSYLLDLGKKEMIIKNIDNNLLIPMLYGYADDLSKYLTLKGVKLTNTIIEETFTVSWDAIKA